MKKFLFSLLSILLTSSINCLFADSGLIYIIVEDLIQNRNPYILSIGNIEIHGDRPSSIKNVYYNWDDCFKDLSKADYKIDQMMAYEEGDHFYKVFIASSTKSSSGSAPIRQIEEDENEVYEVARYNLQGLPVNKYEKGIQIVVYSNYTTKTIIVE